VTYKAFLDRIIDDGEAWAERDYGEGNLKLAGAIAGFEACRDKEPKEIRELLDKAHVETMEAAGRKDAKYWWFRVYEAEVEWVANCVSAMLVVEGKKPISEVTAGGFDKVCRVLGIRKERPLWE